MLMLVAALLVRVGKLGRPLHGLVERAQRLDQQQPRRIVVDFALQRIHVRGLEQTRCTADAFQFLSVVSERRVFSRDSNLASFV